MPKLSAGVYTTPCQSADCAFDTCMVDFSQYSVEVEGSLCRVCMYAFDTRMVDFTPQQSADAGE